MRPRELADLDVGALSKFYLGDERKAWKSDKTPNNWAT